MRQIDFMRAHKNRCIKNIIACVTQTLKTIELDKSVCTLLLTNVKIFLQNDKKSIFEGSGGWAQNGSKTWSKCHFLLLYRRKSGQKVGKTQSFNRDFLVFQKTPRGAAFVWFLAQKSQGIDFYNHWCSRVCTQRKQQRAAKSFLLCVQTWVSWF